MKKHLLPVLFLALLAGCLGAPTPRPTLHSLAPLGVAETLPEPAPGAVPLYLLPVGIPHHLDRPQIAIVSADDPDVVIPKMRQEMEAAGIDELIDDIQQQLDQHLAEVSEAEADTPETGADTAGTGEAGTEDAAQAGEGAAGAGAATIGETTKADENSTQAAAEEEEKE